MYECSALDLKRTAVSGCPLVFDQFRVEYQEHGDQISITQEKVVFKTIEIHLEVREHHGVWEYGISKSFSFAKVLSQVLSTT